MGLTFVASFAGSNDCERSISAGSLRSPAASILIACCAGLLHGTPKDFESAADLAGVLAFAVWHKSELNPSSYVITDVISRHAETLPADPDAPGAFRFAELGKLAGILAAAGANEIHERVFKFDIAAPISPEEFWEMRSGTSETLRAKLAKLSDDKRSQMANEVCRAVKEFFPNNQMCFPAQMLIVTGIKRV